MYLRRQFYCVGWDLGAQLINADIFLGSKAGVLYVRDGNYTWSTHLNDAVELQLQPNRVVWFGCGVITCIGADPSHNPYPGPMMALQDNTIIQGMGNSTIFDEPDSSVIFATVTGAGVHLRDFTIQNIANTDPLTRGTSLPNIGFNNGSNCSVVNVLFKNTRSLAVSADGCICHLARARIMRARVRRQRLSRALAYWLQEEVLGGLDPRIRKLCRSFAPELVPAGPAGQGGRAKRRRARHRRSDRE
jgi:hypothetical protein